MQNREPRIIQMPKKRTDNRAARMLGTAFVVGLVGFAVVASALLAVAVVAGLWRFISWAVGA